MRQSQSELEFCTLKRQDEGTACVCEGKKAIISKIERGKIRIKSSKMKREEK